MTFNQRLKEVRQQNQKTQKDVAKILGMTTNAYQKYELGTLEPNLTKLVTLANLFNISLDDLLCRDNFIR